MTENQGQSQDETALKLDELLSGLEPGGLPTNRGPRGELATNTYGPKLVNTLRRHSYWYDALIDWMISNPGSSMTAIAKEFKKNLSTISMIVNSDMFKARFELRRKELNERMAEEIATETSTVALLSLREVSKRLRDNPAAIPIGQLTEISHSTLDRLGYGQKPLNNQQNNVVVNVTVPQSVLSEARQSMRELHSKNSLDAQPHMIELNPEG